MMFRSIGYALSWDYWRRGMYWFVPACAILVVALMAPAYAAILIRADVRVELNYAIFGVVCWAPLVMALASRSHLRRQYTLPVPSASLAGWAMANGALAVAITYWLVALAFNALFHAGWPLWGPAWWAVVAYAAFQTAVWSVQGARGGWLTTLVLLALLVAFAGAPGLFHRVVPTASDTAAGPIWPTISALELAASLVATAVVCAAAVWIVGRDRRGDGWSLAWIVPSWWAQRVGGFTPAQEASMPEFRPRTFRSPRSAQFWMEWRSKGRYMPIAVACAFAALWAVAALNRLEWNSVTEALSGLWALFLVSLPFVGIYLGHRSERFDMKPFLATRPLSDGQQATVVLWHVAAACGAGAMVWFVCFAMTSMIWGPRFPSSLTWHDVALFVYNFWPLLGVPLILWTFAALGAALGMARSWFVPAGGIGAVVVLFILGNVAGNGPPFFAAVAAFLLVAGSAGGTAVAFVAARRRKLISMPVALGALAAYIVLVAACFLIVRGENGVSLEGIGRIVGFCAVPLAPVAAAPLALAWNRHR